MNKQLVCPPQKPKSSLQKLKPSSQESKCPLNKQTNDNKSHSFSRKYRTSYTVSYKILKICKVIIKLSKTTFIFFAV